MMIQLRVRNTPRELRLLAVGAALLLFVGAVALTMPLARIGRLWREAAGSAAQERELADQLAPLREWLAPELANAPVRILGGDSPRGAVPELLDRLGALGESCAVKVTGMSPRISAPRCLPTEESPASETTGPPSFALLTVRIEARASFLQLGHYFEEVARLDVPLTVRALRLEPARAAGDPVTARFTLGGWIAAPANGVGAGGLPTTQSEDDLDEAA